MDLLYQTGMRRAELIALKTASVDLFAKQVKVIGKRNKERIIPINAELVRSIEIYLESREKVSGPDSRDAPRRSRRFLRPAERSGP